MFNALINLELLSLLSVHVLTEWPLAIADNCDNIIYQITTFQLGLSTLDFAPVESSEILSG